MTNRLISEKNVSWNFVPPFDFTASFLASRAHRRGEQTIALASEKSGSPVWCPLFENVRTYFERNWRRVSRAKLNARARRNSPLEPPLPPRPRGRPKFFRRQSIRSCPCPSLPMRGQRICTPINLIFLKFWCNIIISTGKWYLQYNVNTLLIACQTTKI